MADPSSFRRNLWSLTVLCLLRERPMHPYEMRLLIRQRNKDEFLDLKPGSLYHAIERLLPAGLIEVAETGRAGKRPERTIYRITTSGEQYLIAWLQELLARPQRDTTQFFAALSFLGHLAPTDVQQQLSTRLSLLEQEIAGLDAALQQLTPHLGRLLLLETEYARAVKQAELDWLRGLVQDIRGGSLQWDPEALRVAVDPAQSDPARKPKGRKSARNQGR